MATRKVLLCVIATKDVSLMCAVGLLRSQAAIMSSDVKLSADVHFVDTLDAALNSLLACEDAEGALLVDGTIGFDADFLLAAMRSGRPIVTGTYPLPIINWQRVKEQPKNESAHSWGNVYNIIPTGRLEDGLLEVSDAELGLAWVRRDALVDIMERHPGIATKDGAAASFAAAGVYDGERRTASQHFLHLWGRPVWANIEQPASSSGPTEFGGCVGARNVLR